MARSSETYLRGGCGKPPLCRAPAGAWICTESEVLTSVFVPEETIVECPHGFCVDAHRHRMSSFAGKYESRLSLLEDVRLQRGAAASDPNYFRSGLLAGVNEKCSHKNACVRAPVSAHAPQSGGVFRVTRWSSLSINLCGHG